MPRCPRHPRDAPGFSGEHVFCLVEGCEWDDETCDAKGQPVGAGLDPLPCVLPLGHPGPHETADENGIGAPYYWARDAGEAVEPPRAWSKHERARPGQMFILARCEAEYLAICRDTSVYSFIEVPRLFSTLQLQPPPGLSDQEQSMWFASMTVVVNQPLHLLYGGRLPRETERLYEFVIRCGAHRVAADDFRHERRDIIEYERRATEVLRREQEEFFRRRAGQTDPLTIEDEWRKLQEMRLREIRDHFKHVSPRYVAARDCNCLRCRAQYRPPRDSYALSQPGVYTMLDGSWNDDSWVNPMLFSSHLRRRYRTKADETPVPSVSTKYLDEITAFVDRHVVGSPADRTKAARQLLLEIATELSERPAPVVFDAKTLSPVVTMPTPKPFRATLEEAAERAKASLSLGVDLANGPDQTAMQLITLAGAGVFGKSVATSVAEASAITLEDVQRALANIAASQMLSDITLKDDKDDDP